MREAAVEWFRPATGWGRAGSAVVSAMLAMNAVGAAIACPFSDPPRAGQDLPLHLSYLLSPEYPHASPSHNVDTGCGGIGWPHRRRRPATVTPYPYRRGETGRLDAPVRRDDHRRLARAGDGGLSEGALGHRER